MTNEQFNQLVEKHVSKMREVLRTKGEEYASRGDRLQNFKDGAALCHTVPEKYLHNLMSKHIIALRDFIYHPQGLVATSPEEFEEKIGDIINYLLLLKGILAEEGRVATR